MGGFFLAMAPVPASSQEGVRRARADIQVQVLDAATRLPLTGVTVELTGLDLTFETDPEGVFHIMYAPVGDYDIRLTRRGYRTLSGSLSILQSGSLTMAMEPLNVEAETAPGRLVGRVTDGVAGGPLVGARVRMVDLRIEALTDEEGRFVLGRVPPGAHAVELSNLGYATRTDTVGVESGLTTAVEVSMAVDPVELEPLRVRVERRTPGLEAVGFYDRREYAAGGSFVDRQAIEDQNPLEVADIFRRVPGAEVRLANPLDVLSRSVILRGGRRDMPPCYPGVYIDGQVVHRPGTEPAMLNQLLAPDQVEGIEVYQGGASTPLEYGGVNASCGVVLIWTRR